MVVGVAVAGRGEERCRGSIDAETSDEAKTKEKAIRRKMVAIIWFCILERGSPSTRIAMIPTQPTILVAFIISQRLKAESLPAICPSVE
jgi:hypothetical protein